MNDEGQRAGVVRAQEKLAPLGFLVGEWTGTGTILGDPVTAQLQVSAALDGTWLEAREHVVGASGEPVHADISFYRFNAEEGGLRVLHLTAGAHMEELGVAVEEGAIHWVTGPGGPQLWIHPRDGGFTMTVHLPGIEAPSVVLRYRPA